MGPNFILTIEAVRRILNKMRHVACVEMPTVDARSLPNDFNDELYLLLNPDVSAANAEPRRHYIEFGRQEGRNYARPGPQALTPSDHALLRTNRMPQKTSRNRAGIYVHFDANGVIADYVVNALATYRSCFDILIFISAASLEDGELCKISSHVDLAVQRMNVGYDFMSWRVGWHLLSDINLESVTFMNDSVYGPNDSLANCMAASFRETADLYGASISREIRPHVQSYFMTFGHKLIKSGLAAAFWNSVGFIASKDMLIRIHEVGLSQMVEQFGYTIDGMVNLRTVDDALRLQTLRDNDAFESNEKLAASIMGEIDPNPMQLFWNEALRRGSPFVKIEVLRSNPRGVCRPRVIHEFCKYGFKQDMILRHLKCVMARAEFLDLCAEIRKLRFG